VSAAGDAQSLGQTKNIMTDVVVHEYGIGIETVIAVHGGPAAAGDLAPLAKMLGERWHVLEPHQRGSSDRPLTVAMHVQDLEDLIRTRCGAQRPVLVGHSWGAMLALIFAAHHPATPAALVLIGCGTFSQAARGEFETRRAARMTPADHATIARIAQTEKDPNRRLAARGRVMTRVYGYDVDDGQGDVAVVDAVAHEQTWTDMVRLMNQGIYPAAFVTIRCPVLMLHGEVDPHPGRLTSDDLRRYIPHLEYREFAKCGHSPWLERQAREDFFKAINAWISSQSPGQLDDAG
jgi:pimeloyl-ACP methyl ester carboxylesterase